MAMETNDWLHGGHYTKARQEKLAITVSADYMPNLENVQFLEAKIKFHFMSPCTKMNVASLIQKLPGISW